MRTKEIRKKSLPFSVEDDAKPPFGAWAGGSREEGLFLFPPSAAGMLEQVLTGPRPFLFFFFFFRGWRIVAALVAAHFWLVDIRERILAPLCSSGKTFRFLFSPPLPPQIMTGQFPTSTPLGGRANFLLPFLPGGHRQSGRTTKE